MPTSVPLPSPAFVGPLADAIGHTETLEQLVRPLLQLMQAVTGLEATYLTYVDTAAGQQQVIYAHNTSERLTIPEKLFVPWDASLCRRALARGPGWFHDVAQRWSDSPVASSLGIATYAVAPIQDDRGRLIGTLCGASAEVMEPVEGSDQLLAMFAELISAHIAREDLIVQLRLAHQALRESADTDALTGLPNRRALLQEIDRRLEQHARAGTELVVGFIDLDGFKAINDRYGHVAGDRFLALIGERLRNGQRPEDYCARLGGDEFVTLTSLGHGEPDTDIEAGLRQRLLEATAGCYELDTGVVVHYPGASVGFSRASGQTHAIALLAHADAAMYRDKQKRRAAAGQAQPPG